MASQRILQCCLGLMFLSKVLLQYVENPIQSWDSVSEQQSTSDDALTTRIDQEDAWKALLLA